jgi:hypothetical protein
MGSVANAIHREPWNKGKIVGQHKTQRPVQFEITPIRRLSVPQPHT